MKNSDSTLHRWTLRRAIKHLVQLEQSLQLAGIHNTTSSVRRALQAKIESLPINRDGVADKPIFYFVLSGDEWLPVHAGSEVEEGPCKDWLNFRTDYTDGSSDSGPAKPYEWAHCTADGAVNYHWLDGD